MPTNQHSYKCYAQTCSRLPRLLGTAQGCCSTWQCQTFGDGTSRAVNTFYDVLCDYVTKSTNPRTAL